MRGKLIYPLIAAVTCCAMLAGTAHAQVKAKSAYEDEAASSAYSDAALRKFIQITARLSSIEAQYAKQPRMAGTGKYHPGSGDIIDQKNKVLQDNKYFEMAEYIEDNGLTVASYQAMRANINGTRALKYRVRDMAKDMGIKNLDTRTDHFKDAPPHVGTY